MTILNNGSKSDQVYNYLKTEILIGSYKPGERVVISDVSQKLGVSAIPVREAIMRLESDGLIELETNKGAKIAQINIKDIEEIFVIRLELETLATRLAAKYATLEEINELETYLLKMDKCFETRDVKSYTKYNSEFHLLLYQASHNNVLIEQINNLILRSENSKMIFAYDADRWRESNKEHKEIVEALKERNEEKAAKIMRYQKWKGFEGVLNALRLSQSILGK